VAASKDLQEMKLLKEKPQLSFLALVENLKKLSVKPAEVVELKDLKSTLVEREVLRISAEKEKRDRVGFFLTQVLSNSACKFIMGPDTEENRASLFTEAAKIY